MRLVEYISAALLLFPLATPSAQLTSSESEDWVEKTQKLWSEAVSKAARDAVKKTTESFEENERKYNDPKLNFGYFAVYTPFTNELSRDARLLDQVMGEMEKSIGGGGNGTGQDYALLQQAPSRKEMVKQAMKALKEKDIEKQNGNGEDYQIAPVGLQVQINPLTGGNITQQDAVAKAAIVQPNQAFDLA